MSLLIERAVIGELVLDLTEQGFRVELCSLDGGGLHLYAAEDGGNKPDDGWKFWIRLQPGNGADVIVDYSVNFEDRLKSAISLGEILQKALD
jgi:hypothetical protein